MDLFKVLACALNPENQILAGERLSLLQFVVQICFSMSRCHPYRPILERLCCLFTSLLSMNVYRSRVAVAITIIYVFS